MSTRTIEVPRSVKLGVGSAAMQVEGGLDNANDIGIYTLTHRDNPGSEYTVPAGRATDHYDKFREDIALFKEMGVQQYRFGVEWARIEPSPGTFDRDEIDHYRNVVNACVEAGISPILTLHHFSSPTWLIQMGGWESANTPSYFANYARRIVTDIGNEVAAGAGAICTLNEINTGCINVNGHGQPEPRSTRAAWVASAQRIGVDPSRFRPWMFASSENALRVIAASHHQAVDAIRSVRTDIPVGFTVASQNIVPLDPKNDRHVQGAKEQMWLREGHLLDIMNEQSASVGDFIGIQPYTIERVGDRVDGTIGIVPPPPWARLTATANPREFAPQSLTAAAERIHEIFPNQRIAVTEFGCGTRDDDQRAEYLRLGVAQVADLVSKRVPIDSLIFWSGTDSWEWVNGFGRKYGLVAVDFSSENLDRTVRPIGRWFAEVTKTRSLMLLDSDGCTPDGMNLARGKLEFSAIESDLSR